MDEPAIADPSRVDADSAGSDGTLDGDAGSAGSAESAEPAGTAGSPESAGSADAPDTPVTAPSHGRAVVGVVVSRDPGPWFEECLASLDAQDLPGFALLVLDDGSSVDITERVAAAAPGSFVRRFESPVGYAVALNHAIEMVEGADYLYVSHDDVASAPDAVRMLVEEAERSRAGVVGPKIVAWDDHDRLLGVGIGVDRTAFALPLVERRELDQAQHDGSRDLVAVPGAAFLVRGPLFASLGGLDVALHPPADALGPDLSSAIDLGWRARLAGQRVVTAPAARVAHAEAHPQPAEGPVVELRNRQRVALRNTRPFTLPFLLVVLAAQSIGALAYTLVRYGRLDLRTHASAWWWNTRRGAEVLRSRRVIHHLSRANEHAVVESLLPVSARLRTALRNEAAEDTARLWSGLARTVRSFGRRGPTRWILCAVGLLATVIVLGSRALIGRALPLYSGLQPLTSAGSLLRNLRAWPATSPAFAGLAVLRLIAGRRAGSVLLVGSLVVGTVGAWRLARRISVGIGSGGVESAGSGGVESAGSGGIGGGAPAAGTVARASAAAAIVAGITYGLVPLPFNAIAAGHLDLLVAYACMPWLVRRLLSVGEIAPFGRMSAEGSSRHPLAGIVRIGLPVAACAAFVPSIALLLLLVAAGVALGSILAGGWAGAVRTVWMSIGAVCLSAFLLLPWSFTVVRHVAEGGLLAGRTTSSQRVTFIDLIAFRTGPVQVSVLGLGLAAAALAALALSAGRRAEWVVRLWTIVLISASVDWMANRGWLGAGLFNHHVALVPAALGLSLCASLGVAGFVLDAKRTVFGWRQLVAPLMVIGVVLGAVPAVAASPGGSWHLPSADWSDSLSWLDGPAVWIGDDTAMPVSSRPFADGARIALIQRGLPDIRSAWPAESTARERTVFRRVREAISSATLHSGTSLAAEGVRYVVLIQRRTPTSGKLVPAPVAIRTALDSQLDLEQVERSPADVVYRTPAPARSESGRSPSGIMTLLLGALALAWLWALSIWRRDARAERRAFADRPAAESGSEAPAAPRPDPFAIQSDDASGQLADELWEAFSQRRNRSSARSSATGRKRQDQG